MRTLDFEIGLDKKYKRNVVLGINDIPYPVAIYFLREKEVVMNRVAGSLLGIREDMAFNWRNWLRINPFLRDEIRKNNQSVMFDQKAHIVLFNGKHLIINYSYRHCAHLQFGDMKIFFFSKTPVTYSVASLSALYSVKDEMAKLKPYLNRCGKQMHEKLMGKYFREENQQLTLDELVYYEKELRIIEKAFPVLTHREVIMCGLLAHHINTKDIATLTNRTLDSIFVSIHRINKKLDLQNKKELIFTIKSLLMELEKSLQLSDE